MKFKSITMKNFMRYKGTNQIQFSCDPEKNVTVILGDNTVGKTTIAQAFRWGLYGAIFAERGKKQEDYLLLNNDVLAMMDANSHASVSVELVAEDEEKQYRIFREISYARIYPKMMVREVYKKLELHTSEIETTGDEIEVEAEKVQEVINELFPRDLSHYFLFDGERWSDVTVGGVKESIKDSVHILTGLSAYRAALLHLKDMGGNSVIRKFKGKISGSGAVYDGLEEERKRLEHLNEKREEEIRTLDINVSHYLEKCEEINQYLEENQNTEKMQADYKRLKVVQSAQEKRGVDNYKTLVNDYSNQVFMVFAQPLMKEALSMVKSVAGERRDIPHMRQASIDFIIKSGRCICGNPIHENSKELECLLEQRRYLPPADMGSLLGEFEKTCKQWENRTLDTAKELKEQARLVDDSIHDYNETCNQIVAMEKQMEEHVDFAEPRRQLKYYKEEIQTLSIKKGELQGQIQSSERRIQQIEEEMRGQEAKNEENAKWRKRLQIAEQLYDSMKQDFDEKEKKVFLELNQQIQENFNRMFNAKDKKIQLNEQYEIQMLYKTEIGFREEKNLSEGEKIARNFAFIVTILDYSRRKAAEKGDGSMGDTLPIVLDGPFSKLGDENISLIAKVLPQVSEQVILFMLKKDWEYTGLDEYVGASYFIEKEADKAYASIQKMGGDNIG